MAKSRVGFIGIGVMGYPMAGHLADAGYSLTVYDIDCSGTQALADRHPHVTVADSPRAVAALSDIVVTMLPSGSYVRDVITGNAGLTAGWQPGGLLVDTSSSEPWITKENAGILAEAGIAMVDAPVSGARAGAEKADLVFMVGGEEKDVNRVLPLLRVMGKRFFHLGPVASGHAMKCINNCITAMTFMATTEGLILGKKSGLDPEVMIEVLNVSTGMSWISQTQFKQRIFNRKFDDPFKLGLMIKDIGIAIQLANHNGLDTPLWEKGQTLWESAGRHSGKDGSLSNMVRWIESVTGTELEPGPAPQRAASKEN